MTNCGMFTAVNKYGLFIVYKNKINHTMEFAHDVDLDPIKMLAVVRKYKYLNISHDSVQEAVFINWEKVILARCWKVEQD